MHENKGYPTALQLGIEDWLSELYRTEESRHALLEIISVSGGTRRFRYFTSVPRLLQMWRRSLFKGDDLLEQLFSE